MYDGVFIMYHRKSDNFPLAVRVSDWPALQSAGQVADGVLLVEGGKHVLSLQLRRVPVFHGVLSLPRLKTLRATMQARVMVSK